MNNTKFFHFIHPAQFVIVQQARINYLRSDYGSVKGPHQQKSSEIHLADMALILVCICYTHKICVQKKIILGTFIWQKILFYFALLLYSVDGFVPMESCRSRRTFVITEGVCPSVNQHNVYEFEFTFLFPRADVVIYNRRKLEFLALVNSKYLK